MHIIASRTPAARGNFAVLAVLKQTILLLPDAINANMRFAVAEVKTPAETKLYGGPTYRLSSQNVHSRAGRAALGASSLRGLASARKHPLSWIWVQRVSFFRRLADR